MRSRKPAAISSADAVVVKDRQHPFVGLSYWPRSATVEHNRAHHCLVDPALCTQRYFTPLPQIGLLTRECGTGKIDPASDLFGGLVFYTKEVVGQCLLYPSFLEIFVSTQRENVPCLSMYEILSSLSLFVFFVNRTFANASLRRQQEWPEPP